MTPCPTRLSKTADTAAERAALLDCAAMLTAPFENTREFRAAFVKGLGDLSVESELGAFILVLANASFDPEIYRLLKRRLRDRFDQQASVYRELLSDGRSPPDAPDDVVVFLKLLAVGFDGVRLTEFRQAGPWEVQFNQLRSFRPPRMSRVEVTGLHRPFDADGFHFNKPFLQKEVLWQGELLDRPVRLLYNKFPFAELHGILVPDPQAQRPQFLHPDDHDYLWRLTAELGAGIPGVGFGYNAYGAYCSVNHQHFQMYVRDRLAPGGPRYPIEQPGWRHRGGEQAYPLPVEYFDDGAAAWRRIEALHAANRSYNLLYRPGGLYLAPRAMQGTYSHSEFTSGFAWSEIAGSITTFRRGDFEGLDERRIRLEYARLAPPG